MKSYSIETAFDVGDKFIVDNLIARKSISLIVASPKKGKTALGLNLGLCIHEGVNFLEQAVKKTKVVYYCNELSGSLIQERIKRLDIPCSADMKFYEGTSYVDFETFEAIIKNDIQEGYEVFVVDTFSKIKYDRKYNANDYSDTYEIMAKYYELIEKYGCTFIMMYHTKKDSSVKSVSEKVIGSKLYLVQLIPSLLLISHQNLIPSLGWMSRVVCLNQKHTRSKSTLKERYWS